MINVNQRIEKYFDNLYIDEIQDFAGNDFNFLKSISKTNINILYVGDFYQHTFDTSRDGIVNKSIYDCFNNYKGLFTNMGINVDTVSLDKSYRCSPTICKFLSYNLKIEINSHKEESSEIIFIDDEENADRIFFNKEIVKLFYREHYKYNCFSRNWGDSKGENHYNDICVVLNKTTYDSFKELHKLKPQTKNKLYVACTRANGNLIFVSDTLYEKHKQK